MNDSQVLHCYCTCSCLEYLHVSDSNTQTGTAYTCMYKDTCIYTFNCIYKGQGSTHLGEGNFQDNFSCLRSIHNTRRPGYETIIVLLILKILGKELKLGVGNPSAPSVCNSEGNCDTMYTDNQAVLDISRKATKVHVV